MASPSHEHASRAPGPRGLPFVGVAPLFHRDPTGFLQQLARDYGDIVEFRLMHRRAFLLNHPDYIREVLVTRQTIFMKSPFFQRAKRVLGESLLTSEGEHHLRQRRLAQPAFHRDRLKSYADVMVDYAVRARERCAPGTELDMRREMMRLTLAIVARTLFSADAEAEAAAVGKAMTEIIEMYRWMTLPFSEFLDRLPLPHHRRLNRARALLDGEVQRIIRERGSSGGNGDLLSTLLAIRDEDGSSMTDEQLRDEILTLFIAGHETTAVALTWTWYLLAQNPGCESRLHAEIDSVLQGRTPSFDDLPNLHYTDMVVAESLRLYPPAWVISRRAKETFELGGITIPRGSICLMSQYVMHHDARFFPDPDRFDPERWRPELREARPKFSYFPFGGGVRLCIGDRFAWTEIMLVIATLSQKWRFCLANEEPVEARPLITLRPRGPVRMIARPR